MNSNFTFYTCLILSVYILRYLFIGSYHYNSTFALCILLTFNTCQSATLKSMPLIILSSANSWMSNTKPRCTVHCVCPGTAIPGHRQETFGLPWLEWHYLSNPCIRNNQVIPDAELEVFGKAAYELLLNFINVIGSPWGPTVKNDWCLAYGTLFRIMVQDLLYVVTAFRIWIATVTHIFPINSGRSHWEYLRFCSPDTEPTECRSHDSFRVQNELRVFT